jgi:hypothetical protein
MTERYVDTSQLPIIRDKNSWTTFVEEAEQKYEYWGITCRSCYREYHRSILIGLFILVIGMIIILVISLNSATPSYPCIGYDTFTLASTVSVSCLQHTWNKACPSSSYTFSQGYTGWWNQSPQGSTLTRCRGTTPCGVGSYGNILVYMRLCQINYGT